MFSERCFQSMRRPLGPVYFLLITLIASCAAPPPTDGTLPFTTLEQKDDAGYAGQQQYNALEPGMMVFADAAAMGEGGVWFSEAARQAAAQVDWRTHFVIAVFQGWQVGEGYGITVEAVALNGDTLTISAATNFPEGTAPGGRVTSPYHLIAVRRPPIDPFRLKFALSLNGQSPVRIITPIP